MKKYLLAASVLLSAPALANFVVPMHSIDAKGVGAKVGEIEISESAYGLVFTPNLQGLTQGAHGFHVHELPSCAPSEKDGKTLAGGAAGGHFDPYAKKKHGAPWGDGHLGDLPAIVVLSDGSANQPVLAPRLKRLADIKGRALMLHVGGDNHADHPAPLGGGGARMVCGVIE